MLRRLQLKTILSSLVILTAASAFVSQAGYSGNPVPAGRSEVLATGRIDSYPDTLTAGVSVWDSLKADKGPEGLSREVLKGSTNDLSVLDIRAYTLEAGQSVHGDRASTSEIAATETATTVTAGPPSPTEPDILVIVKGGSLTVSSNKSSKLLQPGGVALFAAGEAPGFANTGTTPVTWYVFHFKSRSAENRERARQAGASFLIDWKEMVMKPTAKGESRQIFDRPVAWLGKIDLHATTLNAGEVSHAPHIHRAEEIILMRSGHVQMYIGGQYHKATAGDLVFLSSGVPHALENKSSERCEYFALQWMP